MHTDTHIHTYTCLDVHKPIPISIPIPIPVPILIPLPYLDLDLDLHLDLYIYMHIQIYRCMFIYTMAHIRTAQQLKEEGCKQRLTGPAVAVWISRRKKSVACKTWTTSTMAEFQNMDHRLQELPMGPRAGKTGLWPACKTMVFCLNLCWRHDL